MPGSDDAQVTAAADGRVSVALFLFTAVVYGYFFGGGGWNQNAHFDLTRALVETRSVAIDRFAGNTGDVVVREDHIYANKAPGVSFLAVLPYEVLFRLERANGLDPGDPLLVTLNAYLCTFLVCGLLGALIPAALYRFGLTMGSTRREALAVALLTAFATPLFAYSSVFFLHVPSAAFILLSFLEARKGSASGALRSGLWVGASVVTNYLALPVAAILGLWLAVRERSFRPFLRFTAGLMPGLLLLIAYHLAAFGGVLRNPVSMNPQFVSSRSMFGIVNAPSLEALIGITVSPYRGLFFLSPILILALGGAVVRYRQGARLELAVIASCLLVFFGFNVTFNNWEGGFGIGPRYLVPVIPLLAVLLLAVTRFMRPLWIILAPISLILNFVAVAVDPQPSGSIGHPFRDYLFPLFLTGRIEPDVPLMRPWMNQFVTGHVAVNLQSMDQIVPMARHAPESQSSIWASFNLGETLAGPGSLLSLLPLLVWAAFGWLVLRALVLRAGKQLTVDG